MREIKDNRPDKESSEYRRPGGPPVQDKISPLRGKKQRWALGRTRPLLYSSRREAMIFFKGCPIEMQRLIGLPQRVFV